MSTAPNPPCCHLTPTCYSLPLAAVGRTNAHAPALPPPGCSTPGLAVARSSSGQEDTCHSLSRAGAPVPAGGHPGKKRARAGPKVAFQPTTKDHDGLAPVSLVVDNLCHSFFIGKCIRSTHDVIAAVSRTVPAASGKPLYQLHVQSYLHVLDLVARLQAPPPTRGTKRGRGGRDATPPRAKRPRGQGSLDPVQAEEEDDSSSDGTGEPEGQCAGLPEDTEAWGLPLQWEGQCKGECEGGEASPSSLTAENPHPAAPPTPTPDVPVLPGGGGRVLKVSPAHLPFLVLLARLQYSAIQKLAGTSNPMV